MLLMLPCPDNENLLAEGNSVAQWRQKLQGSEHEVVKKVCDDARTDLVQKLLWEWRGHVVCGGTDRCYGPVSCEATYTKSNGHRLVTPRHDAYT